MTKAIEDGWLDESIEQVGLRGDQFPLKWDETYLATKTKKPGIYMVEIPLDFTGDSIELAYKIKVEGEDNPDDGWQQGRNHQLIIYKNKDKMVNLSWEDEAQAPLPTITGNVHVIDNFESKYLPKRDIHIYLPPDYSSSNKPYKALYMHDGQNLFDASEIGQEWGLDEAAEKLIKSKQIDPLIIIGIGNTKDRIEEYTPTRQIWNHTFYNKGSESKNKDQKPMEYETKDGLKLKLAGHSDSLKVIIPGYEDWQLLEMINDSSYFLAQAGISFNFNPSVNSVTASKKPMGGKGNLYEQFLIEELKPYIDSTYRTKKQAQYSAIGGSSLGGLISLHIGLKHPDHFGKLVIASPSLWWDNKYMLDWVKSIPPNNQQKLWLYVGTGEGKQTVHNLSDFKEMLIKLGWPKKSIAHIEVENALHNEGAWKEQASAILEFVSED